MDDGARERALVLVARAFADALEVRRIVARIDPRVLRGRLRELAQDADDAESCAHDAASLLEAGAFDQASEYALLVSAVRDSLARASARLLRVC